MNVYTIADDLSQDTAPKTKKQRAAERRAARRKKIKKGLRKFGRGLATVFAAPARGAFLAIVALNLNAMASRLTFAKTSPKTKAEWEKIKKLWKKLGGRVSKLEKAMATGQKKKPFFFSKKARRKFTAKAKAQGIKAKGINGTEGIYLEPATTAALISASAGVLAAMIPIIMQALKKGDKPQELQQQAQEAQEVKQELESRPEVRQEMQQQQQLQQQEPESMEGYDEINALDPSVLSSLTAGLSTLAGAGITAGMAALERKARKNPKTMAILKKGNDAVEDYAVGRQLRNVGATDTAKNLLQDRGGVPTYVWILGAAGLTAVLLLKKK